MLLYSLAASLARVFSRNVQEESQEPLHLLIRGPKQILRGPTKSREKRCLSTNELSGICSVFLAAFVFLFVHDCMSLRNFDSLPRFQYSSFVIARASTIFLLSKSLFYTVMSCQSPRASTSQQHTAFYFLHPKLFFCIKYAISCINENPASLF